MNKEHKQVLDKLPKDASWQIVYMQMQYHDYVKSKHEHGATATRIRATGYILALKDMKVINERESKLLNEFVYETEMRESELSEGII